MPVRAKIKPEERQSAWQLILDLIAASGGELRGKTKLNKMAYFAHVKLFQDHGLLLTTYPIVKLPMGPCLEAYEDLLTQLEDSHRIAIESEQVGPYMESVYKLIGGHEFDPDTPRGQAIAWVVQTFNQSSAVELSKLSHEASRSWQSTEISDEMLWVTDVLDESTILRLRRAMDEGDVMPTAQAV